MAAILITGANGQLGSELRDRKDLITAALKKSCGESESVSVHYTDIRELDVCDPEAVKSFIKNNGITHIINCAAFTAVDKAEENLTGALKLNGFAPGYLANALKMTGGFLIHISTDYVFEGLGPLPYKEDYRTSPLTTYGRTKLEGEKAVIASGCRHAIIRTSWLYSCYGSNFVKTMLRLATGKDTIDVVFDQIGTPTYAGDLADAIIRILSLTDCKTCTNEAERCWEEDIYHYSNEGVCSWYDFAYETIELAKEHPAVVSGQKINCRVMPVSGDKFPTLAKRPPFSLLSKDKIKAGFSLEIPHWRASLKRCIKMMENNNVIDK